jgi:hypothetical protein
MNTVCVSVRVFAVAVMRKLVLVEPFGGVPLIWLPLGVSQVG